MTRTRPNADRSAERWREAGFDPVIAPLLTVRPVADQPLVPDDAELIFTSANGVRFCGLQGNDRRVYTVGKATADAAKASGFTNVTSGDKDWKTLSQIIEKTDNPIVHLSGSVVRGDLVGDLRERGFKATRQVVYETVPVTSWPIDVDDVNAVALYSPLAAETLMNLPVRDFSSLTAFCLSENVAAPLCKNGVTGMTVHIAKNPNEMSLIACSLAQDG